LTGPLRAILRDVARFATEVGVFLVGGSVRDLLTGREGRDVDLLVLSDGTTGFPSRFGMLPGWKTLAAHDRFGTATFAAPSGLGVDAALARKESYPTPGALPVVVAGVSVEEDLARRDFTVHAMAMEVDGAGSLGPVIDPFGGQNDLAGHRLRLLHARSLSDDPTRAFRAVRYECRLGLRVTEPEFSEALSMSRKSGAWDLISGDRLRNALEETLAEDGWREACARLGSLGILALAVDGWETFPGPVSSGATGLEARWRALLAPLSPGMKEAVAHRLNFSRRLRQGSGTAP
jgi:tRNA nucleotidyltransferase/poly(A) polymerase